MTLRPTEFEIQEDGCEKRTGILHIYKQYDDAHGSFIYSFCIHTWNSLLEIAPQTGTRLDWKLSHKTIEVQEQWQLSRRDAALTWH